VLDIASGQAFHASLTCWPASSGLKARVATEIPLLLGSTLNFINFPTNDDCGVRMAYAACRMAEPCFSNPLPQVP